MYRVRVVSLPSHFGDETWWMATNHWSQVLKKAYTSQCDIWSLGVPQLWTFTRFLSRCSSDVFSIRKTRVDNVCTLWRSSNHPLAFQNNVHYWIPTTESPSNVAATLFPLGTSRQLRLRSLPSCCFLVTCPSLALRRSCPQQIRPRWDSVGNLLQGHSGSSGDPYQVVWFLWFVCFWISKVQTRNISSGWPAKLALNKNLGWIWTVANKNNTECNLKALQ